MVTGYKNDIIRLKNTRNYDLIYSGISITFFPISVVVLPFMIFVIVMKSERFNDFILKIQYGVMILVYSLISFVLSIFLIPCLYVKCIANAIFIYLYNKRQSFKGESIILLIVTVLFNPFIVVISLLIDFLTLPSLLLQDEKNFEFKY